MDPSIHLPENIGIAAFTHELAKRWRTVDAEQLEGLAEDLAHDAHLRQMPPNRAAIE